LRGETIMLVSISSRPRKTALRFCATLAVVGIVAAGVAAGVASAAPGVVPPPAGTGLTVQYFRGIALQGDPVVTTLASSINFNWRRGAPAGGVPRNQFSARFSGDLVAPTTGVYTFYARADDGVRLTVNGTSVINDWTDHSVRVSEGSVSMVAGQRAPAVLEYYENFGQATVSLEWSGPEVVRQLIPTSHLFPTNIPNPTTVPTTISTTTIAPTTLAPSTLAPTTLAPTTVPSTTQPPNSTNTFYVAINGNDGNPGTQQAPWQSIQKATNTLTAGQTVLVGSGVFNNRVFIERSGTPGRYITYAAAPGAKPVIRITQPNEEGVTVYGASYIRVEGFEIVYEGPNPQGNLGLQYTNGVAAYPDEALRQPHHVEFVKNRVHEFPGQGIGSGQTDYMLIERNTIWNNSKWNPYQTSGISLYQSADFDLAPGFHNVIRGNIVFQNENKVGNLDPTPVITDGNCIIIDDQRRRQNILIQLPKGPYESDTLIENNLCAGNGGRGVHVFNSDNVLVRNNTFYNNMRTPGLAGDGELNAAFYYDPTKPDQTVERQAPQRRGNVRFVNNLIISDRAGAKYGTNDDRDRNNVVFQRNFYAGTKPLPADGFGVLNSAAPDDILTTVNPLIAPNLFASQGDFRLKPGSAPIDAARADGSPLFDLTGYTRPFGSAPDIGAYEWHP
jgi:parallel beta-helix repeat protein